MRRRSFLWDLTKAFVGALLVILILNQWVLKPVKVVGNSMDPTLKDGQAGFSNILIHKLEPLERFDVVIIDPPTENELIVKRIVGLPNETIQMKNDVLTVDGVEIEEPYLNSKIYQAYLESPTDNFTSDFGPITLGSNQYYVLGDNRIWSNDSRYYGPFNSEHIVAKDMYIFFPFNEITIIRK